MGCPKNIKKGIFGIKYEAQHEWRFSYLQPDINKQYFYEHFYCPLCECDKDGIWMNKEELVRKYGFLPEFKWFVRSYWSLSESDIEEQRKEKTMKR